MSGIDLSPPPGAGGTEPNVAPKYRWTADIERRFGVPGGRFTSVSTWFSGFLGAVITIGAYAAANPFRENAIVQMFTDRGPIQYVTMYFAFWTAVILWLKATKIAFQRRTTDARIVPHDPHFILSAGTASVVLDQIHIACDDPRQFILFNRIQTALSNLKNMGRIGDFEDVLRAQAENDEDRMETSYSLCKGLIWAIPVLGFIGTVQGLSTAVGNFGAVLMTDTDVSSLKPALRGVTSGLAVAFETTLVALVAALALQLTLTLIKRGEEDMLDGFRDYCQRNLVNRLRISPMDGEG